jgi:hypothetical protein
MTSNLFDDSMRQLGLLPTAERGSDSMTEILSQKDKSQEMAEGIREKAEVIVDEAIKELDAQDERAREDALVKSMKALLESDHPEDQEIVKELKHTFERGTHRGFLNAVKEVVMPDSSLLYEPFVPSTDFGQSPLGKCIEEKFKKAQVEAAKEVDKKEAQRQPSRLEHF